MNPIGGFMAALNPLLFNLSWSIDIIIHSSFQERPPKGAALWTT